MLSCPENFSRFHLQDEHKRFVNQYMVGDMHQTNRKNKNRKRFCKIYFGNYIQVE